MKADALFGRDARDVTEESRCVFIVVLLCFLLDGSSCLTIPRVHHFIRYVETLRHESSVYTVCTDGS